MSQKLNKVSKVITV